MHRSRLYHNQDFISAAYDSDAYLSSSERACKKKDARMLLLSLVVTDHPAAVPDRHKFSRYFAFRCPMRAIQSHQVRLLSLL